jgi:hypothetical protein
MQNQNRINLMQNRKQKQGERNTATPTNCPRCGGVGNGEAYPSILVYCLKLSKLVVKRLTDVDATSPTLNMLDCLSEGHAQALHHLKQARHAVRKSTSSHALRAMYQ